MVQGHDHPLGNLGNQSGTCIVTESGTLRTVPNESPEGGFTGVLFPIFLPLVILWNPDYTSFI